MPPRPGPYDRGDRFGMGMNMMGMGYGRGRGRNVKGTNVCLAHIMQVLPLKDFALLVDKHSAGFPRGPGIPGILE
ncbi:hypothetical protein ElyMa_000538100, partial [Elysia marginata]